MPSAALSNIGLLPTFSTVSPKGGFRPPMRFETMQFNAREKTKQSVQSSAAFNDPAAFFDSASSRKWEGKLTDDDLTAIQQRLAELLPEADAHWLQSGGVFPTERTRSSANTPFVAQR